MAWTDAFLRVPRWHQRPSGLFVLTEISRPVVSETPAGLPEDVGLSEPDLILIGKPPSSFEQMRTFVDEAGLDLAPSTPKDLIGLVRKLGFETAFVALAQLSAHVSHIRGDTPRQLDLAQVVFGDSAL